MPKAPLQFLLSSLCLDCLFWQTKLCCKGREIFLHTSVVDVFFFTPQKWNKIHFLEKKSVHVPDAGEGNVRRKGRIPGRV